MSLVMEINGPVAIAGSILNFSRVSGTKVPKTEANMTTQKIEMDTAKVVTSCPWPSVKKLYRKTSIAIMLPLSSPTPSSFSSWREDLRMSREPLARP